MLDFLLDIFLSDIYGILFQIFIVIYGIGWLLRVLSGDFGKGGGSGGNITLNM